MKDSLRGPVERGPARPGAFVSSSLTKEGIVLSPFAPRKAALSRSERRPTGVRGWQPVPAPRDYAGAGYPPRVRTPQGGSRFVPPTGREERPERHRRRKL